MRNLVLKIHLYAGLLCSSYLVIYGISSLNFNHQFGKPGEEKVKWERSIAITNSDNDQALSESVRDALGLMGWPLPWETQRDKEGNFQFGLSRPGKHYTIRVLFGERRIVVEETRKGIWAVVNSLHGHMGVPPSTFMGLWRWYTELSTWVVLFAAVSGIYLWTRRRNERNIGIITLSATTGASLLFMFYVWWIG